LTFSGIPGASIAVEERPFRAAFSPLNKTRL
jgi:hypothetical protein